MSLESEYIKGFNDGYLISKHQPELIEQVIPSLSEEIDYQAGMKEGSETYIKEQSQEKLDELSDLRDTRDNEHDLSPDR